MNDALDLEPGTVIQDTYRVDELLGRGGMGATFRGVNLATDHAVAVKIMIPNFAENARAVDLFKRESSMLRQVQHDAVVRYETTMQDREGRLYLVMEFVDGKRLADYVKKGARLPPKDVLKLGLRLAGGLAAIHDLRIVHRDVATDNIMLPDGKIENAKFIDFGLASNTVGTDQSIIGDNFAGKMNFAAPEQFGHFGNKVTKKTDYYALGLVLTKVSGFSLPGEGKGMGAIEDRREDISLGQSGNFAVLGRTLETLLKADPSDRPDDVVSVFRNAIVAQQKLEKAEATPKGRDDKESGQGRMRIIVGGLVAATVALALFFSIGFLPSDSDNNGPTSEAQSQGAADVLAKEDPISQARSMIEAGGKDRLAEVLGAMIKLMNDDAQSSEDRIAAALIVAEMYDPRTFDPSRSPFSEPNELSANRYYDLAKRLGWRGEVLDFGKAPRTRFAHRLENRLSDLVRIS